LRLNSKQFLVKNKNAIEKNNLYKVSSFLWTFAWEEMSEEEISGEEMSGEEMGQGRNVRGRNGLEKTDPKSKKSMEKTRSNSKLMIFSKF
jgi:hypothetical protein